MSSQCLKQRLVIRQQPFKTLANNLFFKNQKKLFYLKIIHKVFIYSIIKVKRDENVKNIHINSALSIFQWPRCQTLDVRRTNVILLSKHLYHLKITPNVWESIIHTISLAYIEFQFPFPRSVRPFNFSLNLRMIRPAVFDFNIQ